MDRIVNFIEIDKYMILKAEEARDQSKVKNILDCLVTENSWRLSENFERNCIERSQINIEGNLTFSPDMHSAEDGDNKCFNCLGNSLLYASKNAIRNHD